ncbi:hypothetical protein Droror1_Dr00027490 [Drosera rotundifolia]
MFLHEEKNGQINLLSLTSEGHYYSTRIYHIYQPKKGIRYFFSLHNTQMRSLNGRSQPLCNKSKSIRISGPMNYLPNRNFIYSFRRIVFASSITLYIKITELYELP